MQLIEDARFTRTVSLMDRSIEIEFGPYNVVCKSIITNSGLAYVGFSFGLVKDTQSFIKRVTLGVEV